MTPASAGTESDQLAPAYRGLSAAAGRVGQVACVTDLPDENSPTG